MIMYWVTIYVVWMRAVSQAVELPAQKNMILPYYHELSVTKIKPPDIKRNDSYFGYSITYDNYCKSLVISSPRYDENGRVYDCDINTKTCKPLKVDVSREQSDKYQHDFWLGATVKAGPEYIVTCAPRYTDKFSLTGDNKIGTFSQCYIREKKSDKLTMKFNIDPSTRRGDHLGKNEFKVERFMDSFGWSIDVSNSTSSSAVLIGGPAMYTGRVMVYDKIIDPNKNPKLLIRNKNFPEFNFGYSIASGYFFNIDSKIDKLIYAIGSTYGREGSGSVHFFNTKRVLIGTLAKSVEKELIVGSMFGAVLCAAKFHENGLTDLLVGAPTYAIEHGLNVGVVYVYLANKTINHTMQYHMMISNGKEGSYFGSAIVNLGDLNGDRRDEIAIAAPYEDDGRGAVYLYSGAEIIRTDTQKHGDTETVPYMQRIQPSQSPVKSFGISMTALQDYDENGCNELAVSAPYDDVVFLYKCMAEITVTLDTVFPNVQNRTRENRTNFEYQVCFFVNYPEKPIEIIADLSTTVKITHNNAKLTNPGPDGAYTFNTSLAEWRRKEGLPCHDVGFTLPANGNYESEISINVTSELQNNPYSLKEFDPSRVLLSQRSVLTQVESVRAAECSGDKECRPNLSLTFVDDIKNPYIIGWSDREEFSISLSNTGDIAYDSVVLVRVIGAMVHKSSHQCVTPKSTDMIPLVFRADDRLCTPINPIKTNDTWNSGAIVLNMIPLTNNNRKMIIQAIVFNHRKEMNISKTYEHTISMRSDPNVITIKGISDIGAVVHIPRNEFKDGKVLEHEYTVQHNGTAGRWEDVKFDVILEKSPFITFLNIDTFKEKFKCTPTSETSENLKFRCMLPMIEKKSIHYLVILIQVMSENPDDIPKTGLTAKSTIHLYLDEKVNTERVATLIKVDEASPVPWWIILIAVLIGLFILFIIGFILYECGFLRREKKKDLQALQKSIRRQTMRLSTVPAQDQKQILKEVEEENEKSHRIDNKAFCGTSDGIQKPSTHNSDVYMTNQEEITI